MYDNSKEVNQKLAGCILLYKNRPIRVLQGQDMPGKKLGIAAFYTNDATSMLHIEIDDPELNYRDLGSRLGYMNIKNYKNKPYNEAVYLMRIAVRQANLSQGLSPSNVYMSGLYGNSTPDLPPDHSLEFGEHIYENRYQDFFNMLHGIYPSIPEIREEFSKDETLVSRAFDRKWAIQKDMTGPFCLMYKNVKVGYTEDIVKFNVSDRFHLLRDDISNLKVA